LPGWTKRARTYFQLIRPTDENDNVEELRDIGAESRAFLRCQLRAEIERFFGEGAAEDRPVDLLATASRSPARGADGEL